ncbi:hypothetical protein BDB00DRAFT_757936 [Zychaea mexicana]|uniref:uncharacterized protein n=1 Tax=Zychaea mexicana TaxID=64656 RepID=UPI0022FDEBB0|nr:uncharacterized protein BDB00DRAFT_757936 [Zychaea mexicana]KAI9496660.1 hypothetical protein BDB00DRAFT_757936 [Zychaea mexicana]
MRQSLDMSSIRTLSGRSTVEAITGLAQQLDKANVVYNAITYEYLLSAYAKADNPDQIMPLLARMYQTGVRPSLRFFHGALNLSARFAEARLQARILEEMKGAGYDIKTIAVYSYMIRCMRNNGEIERALDTVEAMRKENISLTLFICQQLMDMSIELNHPDIAYELLKEGVMLNFFTEHHHHIYMDLLRCAALNGSHVIVKDLWQVVLDRNIVPDEGLCHYILHVAAEHGDSRLGSDVIRILGKAGFPYKESHFAPLVEAFAASGDWKSTLQVLDLMRKAGLTPTQETTRSIAFRLGKDTDAVRLARNALDDLQKENAIDILAFNLVIHAFAYNNQYEDAMETFRKASDMQVKIDIETIHSVLDACIHAEEVAAGVRIFNQYIHGDIKPNATTMSKMVTLMCTQDDYEDAFKYLESMKAMGLVPLRGCYYRLVKKLASHQDTRLSIALDEMKACGYQMTAFLQGHIDKHMPQDEENVEDREPRR